VIIVGGISPHDLEALMDEDIRVHHEEALKPSAALTKIGDALPGLGIVAAVLGIVITMGHIDGPPEEIGHHVGAALVGTFLGILLAYGFVGPVASLLEQKVDESTKMFQCAKVTFLASLNGYAPTIAIEFGRKVLYSTERPAFLELEEHVKQAKAR
jgi:chemotaxis protein MotA